LPACSSGRTVGSSRRSATPGRRSASSSDPISLRFRRSGGIFSGNALDLELREQDLEPGEAEALAAVRAAGGFERLAELPRGGADEYQYDLSVRCGDREVALRFDESAVPSELAPLLQRLERRAERR
jgi:hypothetical protein